MTPAATWPKPTPRWWWAWARWALGEGEYKQHGPRKGPRPEAAPERIPEWAWQKLEAFVQMRSAEKLETGDVANPKPHPKPEPTPHQKLMAKRRLLATIANEIAKRPAVGHYSQARPAQHDRANITLKQVKAGANWTGDCSSTVGSWIPHLAGLPPAPSGEWTNTWRIMDEWPKVNTPALGDAVMYRGHVTLVLAFRGKKPTRDLDDIAVFSHGSEAGPYGDPTFELVAGYRTDDFVGFYRHSAMMSGEDL